MRVMGVLIGHLTLHALLGKNLIDAIQPLLWVAAAALKDKSLLVLHTTELLR